MHATRPPEPGGMKPADLLKAARSEALAGHHPRAAELSRAVLAAYPHALVALRVLGWAELEMAQPTARARFRACLLIDPEDALSEVGLGIADEGEGRFREARQHFARAYELDPGNEQIRTELQRIGGSVPSSRLVDGMRAIQAGEFAEAASHLRTASAIVPPDPAARTALVTAIWQLGGRQQVENVCRDLLTTHPNCLKALLYLLALELDLRRQLRVRDFQTRVAALDPGGILSRPLLAQTGMAEQVFGLWR
ncbi:MAG: hypothetical protein HY331_07715 [Chloroflexi bacterium]|nr:hypothetical protein [Chloroflexota bacterium]